MKLAKTPAQKTADRVIDFKLTGQVVSFLRKKTDRIQGLQFNSNLGDQSLKFSKKLRSRLKAHPEAWLQPGVWVELQVKRTLSDSGKIKLRIQAIQHLASIAAFPQSETSLEHPPGISPEKRAEPTLEAVQPNTVSLSPDSAKPAKAKILFCQKSDCMKRQGKAVCAALEAALQEYELTDQVQLKGTGCLKRCNAGPNLVMPDKVRYSKVRPQDVPAIVAKHFGEKPMVAERSAS